jgi:hypothetical protein
MADKFTKKEFIDQGLWSLNEIGDPTTDRYAAAILLNRLQTKCLAPGASFVVTQSVGGTGLSNPGIRTTTVAYPGHDYPALALGDDYCEAVCLAARTLPEFLRNYPECAAMATKKITK